MRVLVFGDSITQGFWDVEVGGWFQRLRSQYDANTIKNLAGDTLEFFNLGVSGDTTRDLVRRFAVETENRQWPKEQYVLIFAIGINDTIVLGQDTASTPEAYVEELDTLFAAAGHFSDKIMFVGLTPVDDKLCNPWIYSSSGKSFTNERILKFEEVLRKFCLDNKLPCVQIFEKFQGQLKHQELLADGLHPNEAGHALMADLVKPEFEALLQTP